MAHPENNGPAGVREVGQVLPRGLIYSRPVVLAVLHSLQPLEISAEQPAAGWGGGEPGLPARVGEAWRGGGAPRWRYIMAGLLGRPGARAAAAGPACWRRPCCWTRCWCRVCGPLAPGRGGGRPGGAAVSLRARFGPAAPPFKPAEVRHHLSLSKPASCLAPPPALASESTSSPLSTTWAAARPPQRISPGVSGRGAWEDAGWRYVHNRIAVTVPSHALMCSALPSRFAGSRSALEMRLGPSAARGPSGSSNRSPWRPAC